MGATAAQLKERPALEGTTRERLLQAAIEMFAERGYAATGVDALCRRAGVAKTGLYWEFHNKVGLLNAVIDRVITEWIEELRDAATVGDPRMRLDRALAALRRGIQERPELFRVILVVLAERTQVDDEAREALSRFFDGARAALIQGIQDATVAELPEGELGVVSELILGMVEGLFIQMQVHGEGRDFDRFFDGMRNAILLLVRELVANTQGRTTLVGPVSELSKPRQ